MIFSGNNIHKLHKMAVLTIKDTGNPLTFGDISERKYAKEIDGTLQIYGYGISKVLKGQTPRGFLWGGDKVKVLQKQFVDDQLNPFEFNYTYPEQLRDFQKGFKTKFDQLSLTRKGLKVDMEAGILNNRRVGVLYHPILHDERELPCFNWYQCRFQGEGKVSLRMLFRSHDWGTAVWANISTIGYAFNELVFKPLGLEIEEIICHSTSAHIYCNDLPQVMSGIKTKFERLFSSKWRGQWQIHTA